MDQHPTRKLPVSPELFEEIMADTRELYIEGYDDFKLSLRNPRWAGAPSSDDRTEEDVLNLQAWGGVVIQIAQLNKRLEYEPESV